MCTLEDESIDSDGEQHASELERYKQQCEELHEALKRSMVALDDWINIFAGEFCDRDRVEEAITRVSERGVIWYVADIQERNRSAVKWYEELIAEE